MYIRPTKMCKDWGYVCYWRRQRISYIKTREKDGPSQAVTIVITAGLRRYINVTDLPSPGQGLGWVYIRGAESQGGSLTCRHQGDVDGSRSHRRFDTVAVVVVAVLVVAAGQVRLGKVRS